MKLAMKIGLPVLALALAVSAGLAVSLVSVNVWLAEANEDYDETMAIVTGIDRLGVAIRDSILTKDDSHAIRAAKLATEAYSAVRDIDWLPQKDSEEFAQGFERYYVKLVSLSSFFLENRAEEGMARIAELYAIQEDIDARSGAMLSLATERFNGAVRSIELSIYACFAVTAAFGLLLMLLVVPRIVVRPITAMIEGFKPFAEGDFTKRVKTSGKDEVAMMATAFNGALDNVQSLLVSTRRASVELSARGERLIESMSEMARSIEEIKRNVESANEGSISQSAGVTETVATMERITEGIEGTASLIERQAEAVTESSAAIEEMLANIASVTETLRKNAANLEALKRSAREGKDDLMAVASGIEKIARDSEGVLEISGVLQGIASQTNLLSMNAAIEAAHAGDSGKGFAVVAEEIRKLAESSSDQAMTASGVLTSIKESVDTIKASTEKTIGKFDAMESELAVFSDHESEIRSAMEEQAEGSKEVLAAIGQLQDVSEKVREGSAMMLAGSREILKEGSHLSKETEDIRVKMAETALKADSITAVAEMAKMISAGTKSGIDQIKAEMAKFVIE